MSTDIVINFDPILDFLSQPFYVIFWQIFINIGWMPIAFILLWGVKELWMEYIQGQWSNTQKKILLAIDIPRGNAQSLRAVENMFTYLAGAHGTKNLIETYWDGQFQLSFSFEIVGIDGYTQFIIRTPEIFRNLVETAVYSQYPDAEISEIQDYTIGMTRKFPDEEWDVWGAEFIQAASVVLPIKTYEDFEHQFGDPETTFRDPLAVLMDLCSSLRKGEQLWYQIIVRPRDMTDWISQGDLEIKKILKEEISVEKSFADKIIDFILSPINWIKDIIYTAWSGEKKKEEKKEDSLKMINLKPKEKRQVEAIHRKCSKVAFDTKIRFIYIAKKDVMNKPKVVNGFVGFMKQFAALDCNNLKPDMKTTGTTAHYFFKDYRLNKRKNLIINNYINRDGSAGKKMGILNTEELATLWHFPIENVVKAPLISKAPGRKAEPPAELPIGQETVSVDISKPLFLDEKNIFPSSNIPTDLFIEEENLKKEEKGAPPANLPWV